MADVDFEEFDSGLDGGHVRARMIQRWMNIGGAASSLALVIGLGVWGYQIAVRDVMGIPIVRALEGPMRIAPENPGGEVADHQGLSVNDVAAVGVATPVPDSLVLAPRPVDLSAEDGPGLAPAATEVAAVPATDTPVPSAPAAPAPTVSPLGDALAPTEVVALADDLAAAATAPEPAVPVAAPVVPGGIGASLRPMPRPGSLNVATLSAPVAAALSVAAKEIDPATLETGTRLVQLGAYDSADMARAEWDRLAGQFGELLAEKSRVIQAAQSGGRTFYRLRAHGFEGEDDARRFCSALIAENAACIPVAHR